MSDLGIEFSIYDIPILLSDVDFELYRLSSRMFVNKVSGVIVAGKNDKAIIFFFDSVLDEVVGFEMSKGFDSPIDVGPAVSKE